MAQPLDEEFVQQRARAVEKAILYYGKNWWLRPSCFTWIRVKRSILGQQRGFSRPARDFKVPVASCWPDFEIPPRFIDIQKANI